MKVKSNIYYNKNAQLEERIYSCRKIVIQSLQKTIHQKMFGYYIKEKRLEDHISNFRVNSSGGMIRVQFNTPQQAMNFYQERSFIDKLLIRKFNIYFDLSASDQEVKKYFLRGINEDKTRAVFDKCKQYGVVRMNILYGYNKMKDTCIFSYLRTQSLSEKEFNNLAKQLETLNVSLTHYKDKQGNESHIKLYQAEVPIQEKQQQQKPKQQKQQQRLITFLTIHNEGQDQVKRNDKEIFLEIEKIIQSENEKIWIQRLKIPTLNPSKYKIILLKQVQFKQEKQAEQKLMKITQWLRVSNQDSIALIYSKNRISTLIINKPINYMIKSKDGSLIIYLRTEQKERLIKIAEIQYQQVEDFIFQQDKIKIGLYKSKQINVFGKYFQFDQEQDW